MAKFTGNNGNNFIRGTGGRDQLLGLGGNDKLWGKNGNDVLKGGPGNDVLFGSKGADHMFGGPGRDHFKFKFFDGLFFPATQTFDDVIHDYKDGADKFDIPDGFAWQWSLFTGPQGTGTAVTLLDAFAQPAGTFLVIGYSNAQWSNNDFI